MIPLYVSTVHSLLQDLGMFSHMRGYYYLTDLIIMAYNGDYEIRGMKYGYYTLHQRYGKSVSGIDRGCRYIIDYSYSRAPDMYWELFRIKSRPPVTQFVFSAVEYLRDLNEGRLPLN